MRENNKGGCLLGMEQGMTGMVMKALSLSCDYGLGYKITWICKNSRDGTLTIGTCCMQILLQKEGWKTALKNISRRYYFISTRLEKVVASQWGPWLLCPLWWYQLDQPWNSLSVLTTCARTNTAVLLWGVKVLANIHKETHMTVFLKIRKKLDSHQQEKT